MASKKKAIASTQAQSLKDKQNIGDEERKRLIHEV
jgi:hypothetical protein